MPTLWRKLPRVPEMSESAVPSPPGSIAAGGGAPSSQAAGGTGTSPQTSAGSQPRRRAAAGISYRIMSGARRVKGYPVTRDELFTLGGVGLLASICFGLGANFVFSSFGLQENLELSQGITPVLLSKWQTRETDYWYFGLVLLILAIAFAVAGGTKIWSIIHSTEHPDE